MKARQQRTTPRTHCDHLFPTPQKPRGGLPIPEHENAHPHLIRKPDQGDSKANQRHSITRKCEKIKYAHPALPEKAPWSRYRLQGDGVRMAIGLAQTWPLSRPVHAVTCVTILWVAKSG
jgi:hypothetical protein